MVAASLIATITTEDMTVESVADLEEGYEVHDEDGVSAEVLQFKNGQLLGSSHRMSVAVTDL